MSASQGPEQEEEQEELEEEEEEVVPRRRKKASALRNSLKITGVIWVGFPLVILLLAVPCGAVLAGTEGWDFKEGFFYFAAVISTSVSNLEPRVPTSDGGRLLVIIFASWGFGVFALGAALLATPIAAPLISLAGLTSSAYEDYEVTAHPALKLCGVVFVLLPLVVFLLSAVCGGIFAGVEDGWGYSDGFKYAISITSGYGEMNTTEPWAHHPGTAFGKILGLLMSCWCLGLYAFVVSAIGSQFFSPLLKAMTMMET